MQGQGYRMNNSLILHQFHKNYTDNTEEKKIKFFTNLNCCSRLMAKSHQDNFPSTDRLSIKLERRNLVAIRDTLIFHFIISYFLGFNCKVLVNWIIYLQYSNNSRFVNWII